MTRADHNLGVAPMQYVYRDCLSSQFLHPNFFIIAAGSLLTDFLFLASARHLVLTSLSTFVMSALLLNQRLESLHSYWFRNATSGYPHVLEVCMTS